MAWTQADIPELLQRREILRNMLADHEAGVDEIQREYGEGDPDSDFAMHKEALAEVERHLRDLGVH